MNAAGILERTDRSTECWLFTGCVTPMGYGQVNLDGHRHPAHRVVFTELVRPVPDALDVGHACHDNDPSCPGGPACLHRRCVRPDHLAAETPQENRGRRHRTTTHCPKGHPYNEANTYVRPNGGRKCRACNAERERERWKSGNR